MSWKTLMVRMLVLLAIPVGLAMAEKATEGGKASGSTGKQAGKHGSMLRFFAMKLDLKSEQMEKFQKMIEKHNKAMKVAINAENERFEAEVDTILTPEQQVKFNELKANRKQKMKRPEAGAKRGDGVEQALQQLNLPADKLAKVQAITKNAQEKMAAAPKGDLATRKEISKQMKEKIKNVLTPEEMTKYEKIMKENQPAKPHPDKGK